MTSDEQDSRSGSVPNAYRNALFWKWAPSMPRALPAAFTTLLYALSAAADPAGKVKFRDGTVIRGKDIAAAARADEKDARRYLDAAIAAGVLTRLGEPKRGRSSLYILVVSPFPDWDAAVACLGSTRRKARKAPPWLSDKAPEKGGLPPVLDEDEKGGHTPVLDGPDHEGERGTRPHSRTGDTPPFRTGDTPPNYPWEPKSLSHDVSESVTRPPVEPVVDEQDRDPRKDEKPPSSDTTAGRCAVCHEHMITRPGRDRHAHCARDPAAPPARRRTA